AERLRMGGYRVLVVDTLRAVSTGDENNNTEMARVMSRLTQFCNLGVTVVFSHHTGKPDALGLRPEKYGSRGASVIPANCDIECRIKLSGNRLTLKCLKSRGDPDHGTEHCLLMTYDKEQITLAFDPSGAGLGKLLFDAIKRAGAAGL